MQKAPVKTGAFYLSAKGDKMITVKHTVLLMIMALSGCLTGRLLNYWRYILPVQAFPEEIQVDQRRMKASCLPAVLGTGFLFVTAALFILPGWPLLAACYLLSGLLLQALIDYDCCLLLDKVSLYLLAGGFFYNLYFQKNLTICFTGLAVAGGIMLFIYWLSRGGMGFGDVKLAAVIGFWLGTEKALLALLLAFVLGGTAAVLLLASGRRSRREAIAFGPFLCLGAAIGLLWGNALLNWYWQLFAVN